jgi:septum formation protein
VQVYREAIRKCRFFGFWWRMEFRRRFVLASASPRRIALLRQIGVDPEVIPCSISEDIDPAMSPSENAMRLALEKAQETGKTIQDGVILGADTIVMLGDRYLGKPADNNDAITMLASLSGQVHTVLTGFAFLNRPGNATFTGVEATRVWFRDIPRQEIEAYVAGGSPMDKAGAYGIQDDYGAVFVTRIEGCYYNVVGLPLSRVHTELQKFLSNHQVK